VVSVASVIVLTQSPSLRIGVHILTPVPTKNNRLQIIQTEATENKHIAFPMHQKLAFK